MKLRFVTVIAVFYFLFLQMQANASPENCVSYTISIMREYLIESDNLIDAFKLLERNDCAGALDLFLRFAESDDLAAQNNVGVIYESGLGVYVNLDRASYWYRKAAEAGLAEAQWNLAALILAPHSDVSLFAAFRPIPRPTTSEQVGRYREALMWSIVAAENGHPIAPHGVRRLTNALPENEVSAARMAALKWVQRR